VTPELIRLHETIRRNLAKRRTAEPWSLEVSTMYAPGEESVAELTHRYAETLTADKARRVGLLFDHRQAPVELDFEDDDELRAALVEAYGAAAGWIDLERMVAEARDPQTREADFRRYFLNQATARDERWVSAQDWHDRGLSRLVAADERVVLGFDAATTATRRRSSVVPSQTTRTCSCSARGGSPRARPVAAGRCRAKR
jgi:hypothetical protein